jgi:hypothetical protein
MFRIPHILRTAAILNALANPAGLSDKFQSRGNSSAKARGQYQLPTVLTQGMRLIHDSASHHSNAVTLPHS